MANKKRFIWLSLSFLLQPARVPQTESPAGAQTKVWEFLGQNHLEVCPGHQDGKSYMELEEKGSVALATNRGLGQGDAFGMASLSLNMFTASFEQGL